MTKAIIFDCFGVVVSDALKVMISELAQTEPKKAKQVVEIIDKACKGLIEIDEANTQVAGLFDMTTEEYVRHKSEGETKDQLLLDYIKELRKDYKTGMLSNVSNGGLLRRFHINDLDKYFDVTVESAEIGFAKPEPEAYEIVADKLGVRLDECIFTDDREIYCDGARSVGMRTILYESFNQFKTDLDKILSQEAVVN